MTRLTTIILTYAAITVFALVCAISLRSVATDMVDDISARFTTQVTR